ncbi:MAG: SCP2 sterol-binding domain-containing protein [Chloroflexi bacterium]|nr:SCP2 sterol-binding domain-containing protein [Chloroflexota bacterium]
MSKFSSVADVIDVMSARFLPEQAAGLNAILQLDISGDGGGQWHLAIADKKLTVTPGAAANPNMTLKMSAADYLSMVNREADPMQMFMQGKVKVGGDMSLAMKMMAMFNL